MNHKPLTISDLTKQEPHDNIWVLNTTEGARRGNVFFPVPNAAGTREDTVIVHTTAAPTELTSQVTRKQLLESSAFRKAVSQGLLTIISQEHADELLADPVLNKEFRRIAQMGVGSMTEEAATGLDKDVADDNASKDLVGVGNPTIQYAELMDTLAEEAALISVRNMGKLTLAEYRHILARARYLKYESVGKYAAAEISKLKGTNNE